MAIEQRTCLLLKQLSRRSLNLFACGRRNSSYQRNCELESSRVWKRSNALHSKFHYIDGHYLKLVHGRRIRTRPEHVLSTIDGISRRMVSLTEKTTQELLYKMFKEKGADHVSMQKFIHALEVTGLQPRTDPRLREFMTGLMSSYRESGGLDLSIDAQNLSWDKFIEVISPNLLLITRALKHELIIPDFQSFQRQMESFYFKCIYNKEGQVASYLPQLARQSPDTWAVSCCTVDGQRFAFGEDANKPFTIHSLSKPLTYGLALHELGGTTVHSYVGQEPSGRKSNELALDHNGKPHNPMISAGAILVGALLQTLCQPDMELAEKFDYIVDYFKKLSGGEYIGFNNSVFLGEKTAGDRNYALGFFLREHNCYPKGTDLRALIDFYHQCCSLEANCNSMAVVAATLANGGVCPLNGETVLSPDAIRDVLSLMHSCGMYEYSGQFAFKVGLPAKSAAAGTLMVVIPNVLGLCTWSPPLDKWHNSCRGVQYLEEMVRVFSFHHYESPKHMRGKKDPCRETNASMGLSIVNLLYSASRGDINALHRHKMSGVDMTQVDYDRRSALHLTAAEGHLPCVAFLVDYCNLPLDCKDRWNKTPLDEAKTFGREDVVEFLEKKMNITENNHGEDDCVGREAGDGSNQFAENNTTNEVT